VSTTRANNKHLTRKTRTTTTTTTAAALPTNQTEQNQQQQQQEQQQQHLTMDFLLQKFKQSLELRKEKSRLFTKNGNN
jgi:hypothetical protein